MKKIVILKFTITLLLLCSCKPSSEKKSDATDNSKVTAVITNEPTLSDYKVGEKLTFAWKSSVEGETRGEGIDVREIVDFKGEVGLWNGFDTLKVSDILNKKKTNTPYRNWPLEVGKKWKYESEWTNESGEKGITSQDAEVLAYEELNVKGGKFMAYKIKYDGYIQNYEAGGKGKVTDIIWYAPKLKFNIKHTQESGGGFKYTNELISYAPPK